MANHKTSIIGAPFDQPITIEFVQQQLLNRQNASHVYSLPVLYQLSPDELQRQRHLYVQQYFTFCLHYYRSLERLSDFACPPTVQQLHMLQNRFDTDWLEHQSSDDGHLLVKGEVPLPAMMLFAVGEDQPTINRLICRTALVDAMIELKSHLAQNEQILDNHTDCVPSGAQIDPNPVDLIKIPKKRKQDTEADNRIVSKMMNSPEQKSCDISHSTQPAVVLRNPRGNQPRSYNPEGLQAALRDVQNGGSIYR